MSKKARRRERRNRFKRPLWRMIDDRSGFVIYSDEFMLDHKGRVVTKDTFDPIHPTEMDIEVPEDDLTVWPARNDDE